MIRIEDLSKHILYLAKKEGIPESRLKKAGFDKITFLVFSHCLKENIFIVYDNLFSKTRYGASSEFVKNSVSDRFAREVTIFLWK